MQAHVTIYLVLYSSIKIPVYPNVPLLNFSDANTKERYLAAYIESTSYIGKKCYSQFDSGTRKSSSEQTFATNFVILKNVEGLEREMKCWSMITAHALKTL